MLAAALQAEVAAVMPLLYPHGLYSSDFGPALGQFLGSSSGLSTATITRMTRHWQEEAKAFNKRSLTDTDFVCMWGGRRDPPEVRLAQDQGVPAGHRRVRADGTRELVSFDDGQREFSEPWLDLLRSCKRRRLRAPVLASAAAVLGCPAVGAPRHPRAAVLVPQDRQRAQRAAQVRPA
ncbi:transposase [Rhodococcus sp. MSC1_016]|jgi:putative transposase|uniref:transposase n=1 Tax=Rhodococcus sp. MSC1_016 TaxID=2909266 RepID=UPI0020303236|nr:transposase [Rhodococcus sp. MSC1_016]